MLKNSQFTTKKTLLLNFLLLSAIQGIRAEVRNGTSGQCVWTFDNEAGTLTISPGTEGGEMEDYEFVDPGTGSILDSYVNAPWWDDRMRVTQVVINDGVT